MKSMRLFCVLTVLLSVVVVIANQPTDAALKLIEAVKKGDFAKVTKLIETTDDLDATDEHGRTALHYAAMIGREDIVKILITKGAEINIKNDYGMIPLTEAIDGAYPIEADTKYDKVIKLLVDSGADVTAKGEFDTTALHWAVNTGQRDFVEKLIAKGAEVNTKNMEGWTPLHGACYDGNLGIAKLLIVNGGKINSKDELDLTPLHRAALFGHTEIVKLLVINGADITMLDFSGQTPLNNASSKGHIEIVEFLIANGADIHLLDKDSETPLHLAAQHGQKAMVEFLIAKGADVNAKNRYGTTPLGLAVGGYRRIRELPKALYSDDYCERGNYFYYKNEFDRALEDYSSAIRLNSNNDHAYYRRGMAWANVNNPKQAIADWKKAIELDWRNALEVYYTKRLLKSSNEELDCLLKDTAMEHLDDLGIVSGYAVGYGASPGEFYTISLIISEPFEEKMFIQMAQSDNPVIRAMAMICFAREDKAKYERQVHSFYKDTAEVKYVPMGCVISTISLDKLARKITEDPNEVDCWSAAHNDWKFKESERDSQREDALGRQVEVIRVLISEGVDINTIDRNGETSLHYAAQHGNTYVAEVLIDNGADVNAKNNYGETPLHSATFWGYRQMIELMVASGTDITANNSKGQTAVDIATQQDYPGLCTLLRGYEKNH